jgi:hypothetical protein
MEEASLRIKKADMTNCFGRICYRSLFGPYETRLKVPRYLCRAVRLGKSQRERVRLCGPAVVNCHCSVSLFVRVHCCAQTSFNI